MTLSDGLLIAGTILSGISVIGMLYIYSLLETSLSLLSVCLHEMVVKERPVKYVSDLEKTSTEPANS